MPCQALVRCLRWRCHGSIKCFSSADYALSSTNNYIEIRYLTVILYLVLIANIDMTIMLTISRIRFHALFIARDMSFTIKFAIWPVQPDDLKCNHCTCVNWIPKILHVINYNHPWVGILAYDSILLGIRGVTFGIWGGAARAGLDWMGALKVLGQKHRR